MVLADTGVVRNCLGALMGYQDGLFFGSWDTIGRPFGALGAPLGVHFGLREHAWTRLARSRHKRPPASFPLASGLALLAAKVSPTRCPNQAKFIKKSIKNSMSFWIVKIPLPGSARGTKMEPEWSQNERKSSQTEAKMISKN